jgi:hypothetical protein
MRGGFVDGALEGFHGVASSQKQCCAPGERSRKMYICKDDQYKVPVEKNTRTRMMAVRIVDGQVGDFRDASAFGVENAKAPDLVLAAAAPSMFPNKQISHPTC